MSQQLDILLNQLNFRDSRRVKYDTEILVSTVRSLSPQIGTLIQNTGESQNVLVLQGTVPIMYSGSQYNIPVNIYVTEDYPRTAPKIYVRPTANMVIKPNHKQVDRQGLVYLPYLHSWSQSTSTLHGMVTAMSAAFGQDPPLYSKVTTGPSPPPYGGGGSYSASNVVQGTLVHPPPNPSPPYQPQTQTPSFSYAASPGQYSSSAAAPVQGIVTSMHIPDYLKGGGGAGGGDNKDRLVREVTGRLQEEILLTQTRLKDEIEKEFKVQQELGRTQSVAARHLQDAQGLRERFSRELSAMQAKEQRLTRWTAQKESEQTASAENMESRLVPYDKLSEQLVGLQAEFLAIDDALYYLERALASQTNPSVNLDTFLRETRKLARRQFLCKSHIRKIQGQIGSHFR